MIIVKGLPSKKNRKSRTARCSPRSSLSNVLYFCSGGRSCLLKKARVCHDLLTQFAKTASTTRSEASLVNEKVALGEGGLSMVAPTRAALLERSALFKASVQLKVCVFRVP